jgi:hypothetical protein
MIISPLSPVNISTTPRLARVVFGVIQSSSGIGISLYGDAFFKTNLIARAPLTWILSPRQRRLLGKSFAVNSQSIQYVRKSHIYFRYQLFLDIYRLEIIPVVQTSLRNARVVGTIYHKINDAMLLPVPWFRDCERTDPSVSSPFAMTSTQIFNT